MRRQRRLPFLIQQTDDAQDLPLPARATALSSGFDLRANVHAPVVLAPGDRKPIPTGIKIALPRGYEAQIRGRSGLALRYGIGLPNAPGTIDADYRGEVHALLANGGTEPFTIRRGDRIAQMVVCPVAMIRFTPCAALPDTRRGNGGFAHSGRR